MAKRQNLSLEKLQELAVQRQKLLNRLTEGNLTSLKERVAFILNHYPETRDSNITLSIRYYEVFHPERIRNGWIELNSFYELPKMYDMQRARATIQNDYGLFLARPDIRQKRMQLAEDARMQYGGEGDILPTLSVYSDESSKDRDFTVMGTVWFYNANHMIELENRLKNWKSETSDCPEEFKFNQLTLGSLPLAKEYFALAVSQIDTISFKAVAIQTHKAQENYDELVYRLYYETLMRGIEFELANNRISLPRLVFLFKDQDLGSDELWRADIRRKLAGDCSKLYDGQIRIDEIQPLNSVQHELLQIADLFTGSIARLLNQSPSSKKNQKDNFTEYVCELLSIDPITTEVNPGIDWVMTHIFRN